MAIVSITYFAQYNVLQSALLYSLSEVCLCHSAVRTLPEARCLQLVGCYALGHKSGSEAVVCDWPGFVGGMH